MKIDGDNVHSGKRWFYCTSYHKRQHLIDNMSYIPGCIEEKWTFGYISAHLRVITTCWRCRCVRTAMLQCGTLLIYYKPVLQYVLCCWWPGIQYVLCCWWPCVMYNVNYYGHDGRESFLISTLRSENLANVSTECFSLHQGERQTHSVKMSAKFSDLKVDIREFFLFYLCRTQLRSNH